MKTIFIVLALAAYVGAVDEEEMRITQEEDARLYRLAAVCAEKHGLDVEDVENLLSGDLSDRSEENQCFVHCYFKSQGYFDEDNVPQKEFIVDHVSHGDPTDRDRLIKIIDTCTDLKDFSKCEAGFELLECFVRELNAQDTVEETVKAEEVDEVETTEEVKDKKNEL